MEIAPADAMHTLREGEEFESATKGGYQGEERGRGREREMRMRRRFMGRRARGIGRGRRKGRQGKRSGDEDGVERNREWKAKRGRKMYAVRKRRERERSENFESEYTGIGWGYRAIASLIFNLIPAFEVFKRLTEHGLSDNKIA
eukprot:1375323-Amorphochlora_amoeboformis.AAC.1